MPSIYQKNCKNIQCSKIYDTRKKSQQYCSVECVIDDRQNANREERVCSYILCEKSYLYIPSQTGENYCSRECSNRARYQGRTRNYCSCGKNIPMESQFCRPCQTKIISQERVSRWIAGTEEGSGAFGLLPIFKAYVLKEANYACSQCGFNEIHPDDGGIIVEVDHIDGNARNNTYENFRVLCPNHHAMTPTFRRRNKVSYRDAETKRLLEEDAAFRKLQEKAVRDSKRLDKEQKASRHKTPTKIQWGTRKELESLIASHNGNMEAVARELGVSSNAVRKRLRNHPEDAKDNLTV